MWITGRKMYLWTAVKRILKIMQIPSFLVVTFSPLHFYINSVQCINSCRDTRRKWTPQYVYGESIVFEVRRNGYFSLWKGFIVWQPHGAVPYKSKLIQSLWYFSLRRPHNLVSIPSDRYRRGFHYYGEERYHLHIYHAVSYGWGISSVPPDYINKIGSLVYIC